MLHYGHIRLPQRAPQLGDNLIVALSTDEFNTLEGKSNFYPYEVRTEMPGAIRYVGLVIPENCWEQKTSDSETYQPMSSAWAATGGEIHVLKPCEQNALLSISTEHPESRQPMLKPGWETN